MIKIAICDNNISDLNQTVFIFKKIASKIKLQYKLDIYEDSSLLINYLMHETYDIVITETLMPHYSGMEIAELINNNNYHTIIIFVSAYNQWVFKCLRYNPFRFIRKSELEIEMQEAVFSLIGKFKQETLFINEKTFYKIYIKNIIYIESSDHYLNIYTNQEKYIVRGKISDYEKELYVYDFFRTHEGYLINAEYVDHLTLDGVILCNNISIPISKKRRIIIKSCISNYYNRKLFHII